MDTEPLVTEIRARLEAAGSAERSKVTAGYFPTAMALIGVSVPDMRAVVRDVSKRTRLESPESVLSLAQALLASGALEERQAAYELLARHRPAMASLRTRTVERLGEGIDNWASVDTFACLIAGPAWRERQVSEAAVTRWAGSKDRWWRRAAVVSTVPLNQKSKGGTGDAPRTLLICEVVAHDHDDMVAKGLSWALRELAVRDPDAASDFLDRHAPHLAARVLREVRNKLTTGLKNPGTKNMG